MVRFQRSRSFLILKFFLGTGFLGLVALLVLLDNPKVQYVIGRELFDGNSRLEPQPEIAVFFWTRSAERGNTLSQYNLGCAYFKGLGVTRDGASAIKWWRKAAQNDHLNAQFLLSKGYEQGDGVPQNYEEAATWLRRAADQGLAEAQEKIGRFYEIGRGVPQDQTKAIQYYKLAAAQGNESAQNQLDIIDEKRSPNQNIAPLSVDPEKTAFGQYVTTLRSKAIAGDADAMGILSQILETTGDEKEALELAQSSTRQGSAFGIYAMATRYLTGKGVEKSQSKSDILFEESIDRLEELGANGDTTAMCWLGRAYHESYGLLTKNSAESLKWYRAAAEGKNAEALAFMIQSAPTGETPEKIQSWRKSLSELGYDEYIEAAKNRNHLASSPAVFQRPKQQDTTAQLAQHSSPPQEIKTPQNKPEDENTEEDASFDDNPLRKPPVLIPASSALANRDQWIAEIRSKADAGDVDAMGILADVVDSKGNQKDALEFAQQSSDHNSCFGKFILAQIYMAGKEVTRSQKKADSLFKESIPPLKALAESGNPTAQLWIAEAYSKGYGLKANEALALKWYQRAAENNDPDAQYQIGWSYYPTDKKAAVEWWGRSALQGNKFAHAQLGHYYETDTSIINDPVEAVKWYRLAAEQGHLEAAFALGVCYYRGNGVAKDPHTGSEWVQRSIDQGDTENLFLIAQCYREGLGVDQSDQEYSKDCEQASKQGHAIAQYEFATILDAKNPNHQTTPESFQLYLQSAAQGNPSAENKVGLCYSKGEGVQKDQEEAFRWFRKAAEHNQSNGQYNLATCYLNGLGTKKDPKQAEKFLKASADQGHEEAKKLLLKFKAGSKGNISLEEIAAAIPSLVKDPESGKYGGPSTEVLIGLLRNEFIAFVGSGTTEITILRGRTLTSIGMSNVPVGTTLYPIRLKIPDGLVGLTTQLEGKQLTYNVYLDTFDQWQGVKTSN